ncbi:EAL domain-containing protein [Pseudogulbenkiania sp. MAI-1]|uniref:bifunctional diguanylate cyclase/phosphodiesterase n=1 Tax=Pseudogulbenkiania sp. MAI-1 TaxID=990370 RepID=UPI00045E8984|nr:EAL domain-containing protein [Pseudogulbenkiania sp. MAI-1]
MPQPNLLSPAAGGLSLRAKLALAFATMIGLTLAVSLVSLRSDYRTLSALKSYLDTEQHIAERSLRSKAAMNKARRYEKDFLLKVREFGFHEAKSRYATLLQNEIAQIRENMAAIRQLWNDPATVRETREIERLASGYESGFMQVVERYGRLGRMDSDLEGELRTKAHEIEAIVEQHDLPRLTIDLLTLRRHEKDFLLRDQDKYVVALQATADRFKAEAEFARLPPPLRARLGRLLDSYVVSFQRYARITEEINAGTERYLATVNTVEPLLDHLYASTVDSAAATLSQTQELARASTATAIGSGLAALLLGTLVAALISRNINHSVRRCMDFAVRIGRGDLSMRLPPDGGHEFTVLSHALNDMADALWKNQAAVTRLNRTLRVLSECNKALVRADEESTLLDDICRHIVDIGGYRLAFVAYAPPEQTTAWQRVAHAASGEGPGILPEEGDTGPTSAAIRTGRTIISHDLPPGGGVAAAISLPLTAAARVLGALTLYSEDPLAFDAEEVALLHELADDLAFGIAALRTGKARQRAEEALRLRERAIESSRNGIVITDLGLPDTPIVYVNPAFERITGYTAAEAIGRNDRFLLGEDQEQRALEEIHAARREQRAGQAELRHYRKDGSLFWNELTVAPVHDEEGRVTHLVSVLSDITERKSYEAQLEHQATHDALTGLANRNLLRDRLRQAMLHAQRAGRLVAVLLLDLDRFKLVNDSLGHDNGDVLLVATAARLLGCVRLTDTVARLGGDEFVILLTDLSRVDDAVPIVRNILAALAQPGTLAERELCLSGSIGISVYPGDGESEEQLLKHADAAMYQAKAQGRNGFCFYAPDINAKTMRDMELEVRLRHALEREEFVLHYQPKADLPSGRIVGMEALIRWQAPDLGMVSPAEFIPVAEESGLIFPIGEWVLRTACTQVKAWQDAGLAVGRVAVNLSACQFRQHDLVERVQRILRETRLDATLLELELTESMMVDEPDRAVLMLQELRAIGLHLSLDDFGTGSSNLSYLRRFPIDTLKIDQSFVRDIMSSPDDRLIAVAVISLAHSLKRRVIAEGVETREQLHYLREHGCDEMQGYYLSRPLPASQFETLLREGHRLPRPAQSALAPASAYHPADDTPRVY